MDIASYTGQDTKAWPGKISMVIVAGNGRHSMREIEAELHKGFTTAAVVFRGEVEKQSDLPIIAKRIKLKNKLVRLETDGSNPEHLGKMIARRVVDFVSLMLPAPLYMDSFERAGRHDFEKVRESVKLLELSPVKHEIVLDANKTSEAEIKDAASQVTGTLVLYANRGLGELVEAAQGLTGPKHIWVKNKTGERAIR